jgi:hypothetical protein
MTLDDIGENQWVYSMQYLGRIFRTTVPNPMEAMSVLEQETLVADLLNQAFTSFREKKLMQRPEDALDEGLEKALNDSLVSSEDVEEELDDEELTVYDLIVDLMEEIQSIKDHLNIQDPD